MSFPGPRHFSGFGSDVRAASGEKVPDTPGKKGNMNKVMEIAKNAAQKVGGFIKRKAGVIATVVVVAIGAGTARAADIALDDPTTTVTAAGTLAIAAVSVAAPLLLWL